MNTQEKIIRLSSRYWQQEIGAVALLVIISPIAAILYYGGKMYVAGGFALVVGITYLISEIRKARRQQITFTESEIIVKTGKEVFKQSWESIKAVKYTRQGQSRLLILYCDDHFLKIPSRFYDKAELTDRLREHVSPSVIHPQAYQRLPWFLDWQENVTKKISAINRPLKVSLGGFEKWLGIFCVSVGILNGGLYFFSEVELIDAFMLGGLFGGLGLLLLLTCIGWMEADNSRISVRSLFKKYTFLWIDLREIYVNTNQGVIALVGDNNRLIVPKVSSWSGKDKEMLHELINYV
jgi:hypothetical protein